MKIFIALLLMSSLAYSFDDESSPKIDCSNISVPNGEAMDLSPDLQKAILTCMGPEIQEEEARPDSVDQKLTTL